MPALTPKPQPHHHEVPRVYSLEVTGLIVIAVVILVVTLIRFWHNIAWSAR